MRGAALLRTPCALCARLRPTAKRQRREKRSIAGLLLQVDQLQGAHESLHGSVAAFRQASPGCCRQAAELVVVLSARTLVLQAGTNRTSAQTSVHLV